MKRAILTLTALMFTTTSLTAFGSQQAEEVSSESHFRVDVDRLINETQQAIRGEEYSGLVWWLPEEFFKASMQRQGMQEEMIAEEVKPMGANTIIVVAVARLASFGLIYVSSTDIRSNLILRDSNGNDYPPLDETPSELSMMPTLFKSLFSQMLGQLGEHLEFFFFPAKNKEGEALADAKLEGSFSLVIKDIAGPGESVYEWNLPLTSALPPKFCPVGGEQVEANWTYCPWHGSPLN